MPQQARSLAIALLLFALTVQGTFAQGSSARAIKRPPLPSEAERLAHLEKRLEELRQELKIPALSVAIVKDQKVYWAKGFGYADLEQKRLATEHTPYHLASLTKTFASTIVMRLVQDGKVNLDDPVSKYGVNLESNGIIRVRHLLSHTSEGNPGENYRYNGNRFGELDKVVQRATGKSFAELLISEILDPLGMDETAPNMPPVVRVSSGSEAERKTEDEVTAAVRSFFDAYNTSNVEAIERHLASLNSSFDPDGGFLRPALNAEQLRREFGSGLKVNLQLRDSGVAVLGDTALLTGVVTQTVTPPEGAPRVEHFRASHVWNRQGGAWKLVHAHYSPLTTAPVTDAHRQRFERVSKTLAQPYGLDDKSNIVRIQYPTYFGTSAGLIASVLDMAKYSIAIDQNRFLNKETQQLAFTPAVSTKGVTLPYGLGWFTQDLNGTRLLWHYGYWIGNSSLIIKVPERNLAFIAMANTDNLSRPTDLGAGDVTSSPVGLAFLKTFVLPEKFGEVLPELNWAAAAPELQKQLKETAGKPYADIFRKELMMHARIYGSVGRRDDARRLTSIYGETYLKPLPAELLKKTPIAQIVRVADLEDKTVEFTLTRAESVRIFAIGEGIGGQMFDYGWIENAETGKPVWEMKDSETTHAGGAEKNRKVDKVVTLPPGRYRLRYKADDSHSFDNWNSLPPDINFWGIALYTQ